MRVEVYGCSGNVFVKNLICSSRVSLIPDVFFVKTFFSLPVLFLWKMFLSVNFSSLYSCFPYFPWIILSSPFDPRYRFFFFSLDGEGGGGVGTLSNGPYWKAPSERGIFFRPQVYERVGISLVEVYERVEKSVIWVCERVQRANRWILWLYKVEITLFLWLIPI